MSHEFESWYLMVCVRGGTWTHDFRSVCTGQLAFGRIATQRVTVAVPCCIFELCSVYGVAYIPAIIRELCESVVRLIE